MTLEQYRGSPQCGNCGTYFSPGQVICATCGAHRYGPEAPVVGPLVRRGLRQTIHGSFWWVLSGVGLALCLVVGAVFGLIQFVLHLLANIH